MDKIDKEILKLLKANSQLTNKEIGKQVHLTGQAVGQRIMKLKEDDTIAAFSTTINYPNQQFIMIYMDSNDFKNFENFITKSPQIDEFYKISGHACYLIKSHFASPELGDFLENLSIWGRYNVETVIKNLI